MKQHFFRLMIISAFFNLINIELNAQNFNIILGRPTDTSVTASILFDSNVEFYLEYGSQKGTYTMSTSKVTNVADITNEIDMNKLSPNTRYYYRMQYRTIGVTAFVPSSEYSFITQRSLGSSFTFTIEADEHLYDKKGVKSMYQITLNNQAKDKPDFMISLGDIFGDDHNPFTITDTEIKDLHKDYRPFLGSIAHSIPFYVCLGNHEGEFDYYYNITPPNNLCVMGTKWRQFYYPNPSPNGFYTGNNTVEPYGIGNPENYYAWTWGDAQFIVLDAYRDQCDTSAKPKGWDWTLGKPQYDWLKTTLETSKSKYKFVFCHHVSGQGRGGILQAPLNEWGGLQKVGGLNTFAQNRPGWAKPIHQLFKDNKVNIFFQGHDHVFAHEILDSVIYQSTPMAADSTYEIGMLANADAYVSDTIPGTGHLRVNVTPSCIKVDFIRAYLPQDTLGIHKNGEIAFSYTIGKCDTIAKEPNSINEISSIKWNVFPNPAKDIITVTNKEGLKIDLIELTSIDGKKIRSSETNEIKTTDLTNGIYFIEINSGNIHSTKKIQIKHD